MLLPHGISIDNGGGPSALQKMTLTSTRFLPAQSPAAYGPPENRLNDYWIDGAAAGTTTSFELLNNHIIAHVWINGQGPFRFLLDTGGHDIVTPELAKRLGLRSVGRTESSGAGTETVQGGYVRVKDVRIAHAHLKNQTFFVLRFEPDDVEGFRVDGMLGFETFWRFIVRIDYGKRRVTLFDAARFTPPNGATTIPFVFNHSMPEVTGAFDGIAGEYEIDTGSRSEVGLTKPFVDSHALREHYPRSIAAVTGWGVGGPVQSYVARACTLQLGSVKVPNVVTNLTTQSRGSFANPSFDGIVGSAFLKRFSVTFDYRDRMLYFERRPQTGTDTGTYDRSGMWINQAGGNFRVAYVTAEGPAKSAGLKPGDLIQSVDGVPANTIRLSDFRKRLRVASPGTVVRLQVLRHGAPERIEAMAARHVRSICEPTRLQIWADE